MLAFNCAVPISHSDRSQATIAAISGLVPTMFLTRVRLLARTESAISAATFGAIVTKCVAPMRAFIVPNGKQRTLRS